MTLPAEAKRPASDAAPNRAALFFRAGLILCFLALVVLAIVKPFEPSCGPTLEYSVVPTEVHGRQTYCITEASEGYNRLAQNPVAQPSGNFCGQNKAELVAQAIAMTEHAAAARKACATRRKQLA